MSLMRQNDGIIWYSHSEHAARNDDTAEC